MILKAAWVLPIASPPIRDGYVNIEGSRIASVGHASELPAARTRITDLGNVALMPGLVNPHTHLEMTCYAGKTAPCGLWDWLGRMIVLRREPGQVEREEAAVRDGAWESLRAGVTCVGDISRLGLNWRVLKPIPIRKVCYVELLSLADEPPRNPDELRAAVDRVEEDELLTAGLTPHAPYTVPADQFRSVLVEAAKRGQPWCTHWTEAPEERAYLRGDESAMPGFLQRALAAASITSPGMPQRDVLADYAAGAGGGTLAHFNYPEPGDIEWLATTDHTVVYCPRSHQYFGHPPHAYREMLDAGVRVALGTDSKASNEDLAMLPEARHVLMHTTDPPSANTLLEMVTINGARAMGLDNVIGTLEPGKQADLAAFQCPPSMDDPAIHLIRTAPDAAATWIAGRMTSHQ